MTDSNGKYYVRQVQTVNIRNAWFRLIKFKYNEYFQDSGETERILQERRRILNQECSQKMKKEPNLQGRFFPSSLTISERDRIAWCRIGKVGTHAWSALFLLLRGVQVPEIKVSFISEDFLLKPVSSVIGTIPLWYKKDTRHKSIC